MNGRHMPPRSVILIGVLIVFCFLVVLASAWFTSRWRCNADAHAREDARSMWEWTGEELSDNPEAAGFNADLQAALDVRLPPLDC